MSKVKKSKRPLRKGDYVKCTATTAQLNAIGISDCYADSLSGGIAKIGRVTQAFGDTLYARCVRSAVTSRGWTIPVKWLVRVPAPKLWLCDN